MTLASLAPALPASVSPTGVVTYASATGAFHLTFLLVLLPAVGAAVLLLGGKRTNAWGHLLGTATPVAAFVIALIEFFAMLGKDGGQNRQFDQHLFAWQPVAGFHVNANVLLDPLSMVFVLLITGVGSLIHIYSIGYMEHDPNRRRFFGELNLFVAAMLLLVLADNFLVLYVGWEGVGVASYLLIGFYSSRPSAAVAAKKAFLVNRVGDVGLSLAVMLMFSTFGTVAFDGVFTGASSGHAHKGTMTAIGLLLLLGACGKSAQVPLQSWLLDAMEGPTPVSALIHAATMVTAGVYLIARSNAIFDVAPHARLVVEIVGATTLVFGAIIGCAHDDIKKVLAASTMSQIGYMMLAVGIGPSAYAFAILHLLTHGFFKANMFLSAGSVMHGNHDEVNMRRFGGLRKVMPVTFACFGFGYLAIIGIIPFAGFFSKDKIIEAALDKGGVSGDIFGAVAIAGAGLTAFYMTRLMLMTFFGNKRWPKDVHPHESPKIMLIPMAVLAFGSLIGGYLLIIGGDLQHFLQPSVGKLAEPASRPLSPTVLSILVLVVVLAGVGVAWLLVGAKPVPAEPPRQVQPLTKAARRSLLGDALNEAIFMRPGQYLTRALVFFDGRGVDGVVNGFAAGIGGTSARVRRAQTGFVRSYAMSMLAGAFAITATLVLLRVGDPEMHTGFPWVTVIGVLPLLGVVAITALPKAREDLAKVIALGASLLAMVASIIMAFAYKTNGARFQFTQDYSWIKAFGAHYAVGVDGIALALILMTTILAPVCILASWHDAERGEDADPELAGGRGPKLFFSLLLATETLVVGVFGSLDVFFFYVLFEAMLIPMYFLIGSFGGPRRSYAAVKFLLYSLAGGLLMLVSVIGLYVVSVHQLGTGTFDYRVLVNDINTGRIHMAHGEQVALFLGFFIAFAIKAPLWPFHTWLPDAASEAPTGTAVMLVGVLDKVGTFGFLRFCIPLFPYASRVLAPYILGLCVTGILYGALLAIGQKDLKRLVAYSSVSHFGFIALGVFAFTTQGGSGATLYMVNHGFSTGALFLVVGFMGTRRGSRLVDDFGGVATVAPWLGAATLLAGLSALALPGLSTFVSEFLVLLGTFTTHRWFAVVATFGIVLAAVYVLWMIQRTIHGPVATAVEGFKDLSLREAWVIAPVLAIIVALGVYPKPLLDMINPSIRSTNSQVRPGGDPAPSVPEKSATNPVGCGLLPLQIVASRTNLTCQSNGRITTFSGVAK